jgi:hypothetical protein
MPHHARRPCAPIARRPITTTFAALALAGLFGACSPGGAREGAASSTSDPALSATEQAELTANTEFAECVRDHGFDDFPDPQLDENGFLLVGAPWEEDLDQWDVAQQACQHIFDEAALPDEASAAAGWDQVAPGGDCHCADGSEFAFWERRTDPSKVVLFLDGGGTCTDATNCAFTGLGRGGEEAAYDWSIHGEDPAQEGGIFDFAQADNPFREHSFIYVPSCTGDLHLGDVTRAYSPELTVEHNGFVNGTATLDYLAEHYPVATQVVVVGKTNGSVAAPVYGGLVADLLPDAQVIVFGAQSGHVPDDPDLNAQIGALWGADDTMPDWEVNAGLTARDWGPTRFWIQAGRHNPDIVLARFDYAYDREAAAGAEERGWDPAQLLAVIDANEAAIEAAGVVQHSYTAPGDDHGITDTERFYDVEVNGVTLVEWVDALLAGQPLVDVHCVDCEAS